MNKEALIQFVSNIDNNIVVCGYIDSRTRKLVVDSNDLQKNADMRDTTKNSMFLCSSFYLTLSQKAHNDIHITLQVQVTYDVDLQVKLETLGKSIGKGAHPHPKMANRG